MPVGNLLYVGGKFAQQLQELGIHTIGDLAQSDPAMLRRRFGARGESAWRCANGDDSEPVRPYHEPREVKSIGNSITFRRNLTGERELRLGFTALAESVSERMLRQHLCCHTVQIQIKDPQFHTISRQVTTPQGVYLARELTHAAMTLAAGSWNFRNPVRLLSLTAKQPPLWRRTQSSSACLPLRSSRNGVRARTSWRGPALHPGALWQRRHPAGRLSGQ